MSEIMRQPGLHELFSAAGDKLVEHVLSDIQRKKKQVWDLLTHWIPLQNINCAHLGTGPLLKFNGIVY